MKTIILLSIILIQSSVNAQMQLPTSTLSACDYCIASQGISPIDVGSSGARYDIRSLVLTKMYHDGSEIVNTSDAFESYLTHQLSMYYSLTPSLSVSFMLPFSSRIASGNGTAPHPPVLVKDVSSQTPQHHVGEEAYNDHVAGLSDILLYGRYQLIKDESSSFFLSATAGVKFPTGATNAKNDEGELLNPHIQLGTGSTDPLLGFDMHYGWDDYSASMSLMSTFPTTGAQNYKFGTILSYSVNGKYNLFNFGEMNSVIAAFGVSGEWHDVEKQYEQVVENTGGNTTYLYPGIQLLIGHAMTFDISYQYAIIHGLKGTQLGDSFRIMGGAQYLF